MGDIKEESVDLELFLKFLNKQVISKEAMVRRKRKWGTGQGWNWGKEHPRKRVFSRCSASKWDESQLAICVRSRDMKLLNAQSLSESQSMNVGG